MTTEEQVRQAKSPQEALVVLAKALDRIETNLASSAEDALAWGEWEDVDQRIAETVDDNDITRIALHALEDSGADLEDLDPSERSAVEAARARLAKDKPGQFIEGAFKAGELAKATVGDEEIAIDLPPVSAERKAARRKFASDYMKLHETYKDLGEQAIEAYVKGGPMWLYLADRAYVIQMPYEWKRLLIEDVNEDSPGDALDMSRDILKDVKPNGPELTVEALSRR